MSSKVYFTDMHVKMGDSLLDKFRRLIVKAGIDQIDFQNKFVAVKLHFGEVGNMAFLRQQYAKVLCDHIKGAWWKAVSYGLQHIICRLPQQCPESSGRGVYEWL